MLEAIILGIVQGLTEFLPISSSAHIRIVGEFLDGAKDPGARFTAITQIGTELAVLIYFRKDIAFILRSWFAQVIQKKELAEEVKAQARMGWLIIIGSVPIVVLGYFGRDIITNDLRSLWLIASVMIIFGVILGIWLLNNKAHHPSFVNQKCSSCCAHISTAHELFLTP